MFTSRVRVLPLPFRDFYILGSLSALIPFLTLQTQRLAQTSGWSLFFPPSTTVYSIMTPQPVRAQAEVSSPQKLREALGSWAGVLDPICPSALSRRKHRQTPGKGVQDKTKQTALVLSGFQVFLVWEPTFDTKAEADS